ncbi:MAG: hypothetical protein AMJ43_06460 [Coxiella sp. DG_40]|nr:MAG: hypothetical protein AMJ43_06460 [Coxiella sp. DG_40]
MSNSINIMDNQQVLERLARQGSEAGPETSVVVSPGARAAAWTAKVKSHSSYNVYNVRAVEIGGAGSVPVEIGGEVQAVNVAESFLEDGQLTADDYVIMFRVGEKYVFYAPV